MSPNDPGHTTPKLIITIAVHTSAPTGAGSISLKQLAAAAGHIMDRDSPAFRAYQAGDPKRNLEARQRTLAAHLLISTSLRVSELAQLAPSDYIPAGRSAAQMRARGGKSGDRLVQLRPDVAAAIERW